MSAEFEARAPRESRLRRFLSDRPDETLLLWAFRGLLVATFIVLGVDLADLQHQAPIETTATTGPAVPGLAAPDNPYLPSVREGQPEPGANPGMTALLKQAVRFELVPGGRLMFDGAIDPGAARRFSAELERRGSYIRTIVINSPGGSVVDALAIARMIRDAGYDTEIERGGYCASSCPLVFAGGRHRSASAEASIGVHRIFGTGGGTRDPATVMVEAQKISAECQRFLIEMGVDPQVWVHAMETPKEELFYFSPRELIDYRLATRIEMAAN